jgi:hypothetical protein
MTGAVSRTAVLICARISAQELLRLLIAAPMRLNCFFYSVRDDTIARGKTNLGNFPEVPDNLPVTFDHFLLNVKSEVPACLGGVICVALIQSLQSATDLQVSI